MGGLDCTFFFGKRRERKLGTSVGLEPTAHLPAEPAEDAALVELEAGLVPAEPAEDATLVELDAGLDILDYNWEDLTALSSSGKEEKENWAPR